MTYPKGKMKTVAIKHLLVFENYHCGQDKIFNVVTLNTGDTL
jgi:hypothetical protein